MERIGYLDAIKGFAIILVVIGHVLAWNFHDLNVMMHPLCVEDIKFGLLWNLMYSFHMALFFMVSGYLVNFTGKSKKIFIKKKIHRLLIPYITTGFIILVVRGHYGYWFFLSLFELFTLAALIDYALSKNNSKSDIIKNFSLVLVLWGVLYLIHRSISFDTNIGDFGKFISYYPAFMLGFLMRKHQALFEKLIIRNNYSLYFISFLFLFSLHYCYLLPFPIFISKLLVNVSSIAIQLIGSLFIFNLFNHTPPDSVIHKNFSKVGRYSMDIYVFHILFVMSIPQIGPFIRDNLNFVSSICLQICFSLAFTAFAIMASIVVAKFVRRSILLNKILLGN